MEIIIPVFGILFAAFIAERFYAVHKKREKFDQEYAKFAEPLLHFLNTIEDKGTNLNYILLTEFKGHLASKNIFINSLKGKNLIRFNEKWAEYEKHYNDVNSLGVIGIGAAIAPNLDALQKAGPNDPKKWESDRKNEIHSVITKLLEVAKMKIWF